MKSRKILALLMSMLMMISMLPTTFVSAAGNESYYYGTDPSFHTNGREVNGSVITDAAVSWSNPTASTLSAVKLYNVSDPENTITVKEDCSTTPGAGVLVYVSDLPLWTLQQFKVEFTFTDHDKTSLLIGGKTDAAYWNPQYTISGTDFQAKALLGANWVDQASGPNPTTNLNIDKTTGYQSSSSLHFTNNFYEDRGDIQLHAEGIASETDATYVVSMMAKANGFKQQNILDHAAWFGEIFGYGDGQYLFEQAKTATEPFDADWTKVEFEVSSNGNGIINFFFPCMSAKDLWIDDIKVYKKGDDTNNLIKGGDFENVDAATVATISGTIKNGTASITVAPNYDTKWVYIYEEINGTDVLRAMVDGNVNDLSLDGIQTGSTLKAVAKNTGAVLSEASAMTVESTGATEEKYYGTNPLFSRTTDPSQANVSWRNPAKECKSVSLYDITDSGVSRLIGNDYSTAAKDIVTVPVSGLVADTNYLYKAVFEFFDHTETSLLIGGTAGVFANYELSCGEFASVIWAPEAMTQYMDKNVTATADGSGSLHISNNYTALVDSANMALNNLPASTAGETYTLKFKMKANEFKQYRSFMGALFGQALDYWMPEGSDPGRAVSFDWKEFSFTVTANGDYNAIALAQHGAQDMWIDDIKIYDSSNNLVKGTTFDDIAPAEFVPEVTNATAQAGECSVKLDYTIPTGTKAVYIYQQIDDKLIWRANAGSLSSITIDGLESGSEQTFVIKALSEDSVLSEGVTVSATPIAPKLETGIYKLYNDTEQITKPEAGNMTVKLEVTNNAMGDDFKPCYIVAVYEDSRVISAEVVDNVSIAQGSTEELSATVNVGSDVDISKCTIKAFLWKNFDTMGILKTSGAF